MQRMCVTSDACLAVMSNVATEARSFTGLSERLCQSLVDKQNH